MKKAAGIILAFLFCLSLFACTKEKEKAPSQVTGFKGKIVEIEEGNFTVEPLEGEEERNSSDRFTVPIEHMSGNREPLKGDIIYIEYNGEILESCPAKLGEIYKISLIDTVVEMEAPKEIKTIGDIISHEGEVSSFQYVKRSGDREDVISLSGEEAEKALSSLKENSIKIMTENENPITGGVDYYVISFSDNKEFKLMDYGFLTLYIDGKTDGVKYSCENRLNVKFPEGAEVKTYELDGNMERGKEIVKEVTENPVQENPKVLNAYNEFLRKVWSVPLEERNRAWGYYTTEGDDKILIAEKDRSLLDKMMKELKESLPEMEDELDAVPVRKNCEYNYLVKNKLTDKIRKTAGSKGISLVSYIDDVNYDIINIEVYPGSMGKEEAESEILEIIESENYPKELIRFIFVENNFPVNPSA